jgi:outer membrane receptor for ferric coprogen and ferric-rhodotorulic acid
MEIERQLLRGLSYRKIAVTYSEVEYETQGGVLMLPKIGPVAVKNHYMKGHLPVDTAVHRQLVEDRAREVGSQYEEMATEFLDSYVAAKTVMRKGYDRIISGEITPDVKETLAAAKMVQDIEDGAKTNLDAEAWSQAMTVYFQTAQEIMPEEMWRKFTSRLSTNPILRSLAKKMAGEPNEEILDAEVVLNE